MKNSLSLALVIRKTFKLSGRDSSDPVFTGTAYLVSGWKNACRSRW